MNIQKAKNDVVIAGRQLVESGLIARTWGNVSCRINNKQFVITPSGRAYETLSAEEIVTVNIEDCRYEGDLKPSSEKGIHAAVYQHRGDINFIIHTHQANASAISPLQTDIDIRNNASRSLLGNRVVCASHALPGTKKLKKAVAGALSRSEGKAFLLAYHGALCLGKDYEEAFRVAFELEKVCEDFVCDRYLEISQREYLDHDELRSYFAATAAPDHSGMSQNSPRALYNSERAGDFFKLYPGATVEDSFPGRKDSFVKVEIRKSPDGAAEKELPPEAEIHQEIYRRNKKTSAIIHTISPDILTVSRTGQKALPLLDDFAQILGPGVRAAAISSSNHPGKLVAKKLKGRSAVLIKDNGALCCGPTRSDAAAAVLVMEKGCKAIIATSFFGKTKPIHPLESLLMRFVYLNSYAKKATGHQQAR